MTEIMPVPRNLILLSYQQGAFGSLCFFVRIPVIADTGIAGFCEKTLLYAAEYSILDIFMVSVPANAKSGGP